MRDQVRKVGRPTSLPAEAEHLLVARIKDNAGNRTAQGVIMQIAKDICRESEPPISEEVISDGWFKSFQARHPEILFGVQSPGETKESFAPPLEDCQRFVKTLEDMEDADREAIRKGLVISCDEMGVRATFTKQKSALVIVSSKDINIDVKSRHDICRDNTWFGLGDKTTKQHLTLVGFVCLFSL